MLLDQVGDDFGVGFGGELVAFRDQFLLEREIVFDDAVVDDDDGSAAVAVGMGVFFGGAAVGGPASVSDAVGAVERLLADDFFEVAEFALGAADLKSVAVAADRDACRVVAAIFELAKTLDDDRDNLLFTYVSHNSAHWILLLVIGGGPVAAPKGALFRRTFGIAKAMP